MKPVPSGWPRLSTSLFYQRAGPMIDWLCEAYGFKVRLCIEGDGGRIEHSELVFGEAVMMVGDERSYYWAIAIDRGETLHALVELVDELAFKSKRQPRPPAPHPYRHG